MMTLIVFGLFLMKFACMSKGSLMTFFIPDVEPREPPPRPLEAKKSHRMRHEAIMGASIATLSFIVFQVFNLSDSLSAQATTVLLLFPMNWNGAMGYARKRAMGTLMGVTFGLLGQILLYIWRLNNTWNLVRPISDSGW